MVKDVGLGYGRQLYCHCLLKYMLTCSFENSPSIPSFLATHIVYIRYVQFKNNYSFSFYLFITLLLVFLYLRDRPFNLKVMVFCFVQKFFSDNTRVRIFFFCRAKREIFFQNSTLGYMTKTLNQIIFFPPPKTEYFFRKKNHNPPLQVNPYCC